MLPDDTYSFLKSYNFVVQVDRFISYLTEDKFPSRIYIFVVNNQSIKSRLF